MEDGDAFFTETEKSKEKRLNRFLERKTLIKG